MNIGLLCYASIGGSGIVATELGKALADRGHQVHFISADLPFRLTEFHPGLAFHQVQTPELSAVPRAAVHAVAGQSAGAGGARVSARRSFTRTTRSRTRQSALLAQQVLASAGSTPRAEGRDDAARHGHHAGRERPVVLGDRRVLDRAVGRRDGGLAEPAPTRRDGSSACGARSPSSPTSSTARCTGAGRTRSLRRRFAESDDTKLVIHVSNFRPVKRIDAVMEDVRADQPNASRAAAAGR